MKGNKFNVDNLGNKMLDRFFRKVDDVKWDLFTGRVGVQTGEGIVTLEGSGDEAQIVINVLDQFGLPVPAFAQNTPLSAVSVGDLIYQGNAVKGWVTEVVYAKTEKESSVKRFVLMTPSGSTVSWTPPKVSMLGFDSGVMVLRSLLNLLPDGKSGLDNMQGMLMPMLMMGGHLDLEALMPMMLFSQLGTTGTGDNAIGMNNNMLQMMLMMQMFGGNSPSGNFFENRFAGRPGPGAGARG